MLSKVSLFTVGIISVVQTNGEHLRTSTGSKYHHPRHPVGCGNSGIPGTFTCGPSCLDKCPDQTTVYPMPPMPPPVGCGNSGIPGTFTCGPSCLDKCEEEYHPATEDPMFHSTTGYPTTEVPVTEDPTMPPTAPTDHYYFTKGFYRVDEEQPPMMAVDMNKKAGCRCANHDTVMTSQHDGPMLSKVASICNTGCGTLMPKYKLCGKAAKDPAFGQNGGNFCSGACKPDTSKMNQRNGNQQNGVTKLTFEDCSNQCAEMGPNWEMIDSFSRHSAEGSGCGFDFHEVWSKHM